MIDRVNVKILYFNFPRMRTCEYKYKNKTRKNDIDGILCKHIHLANRDYDPQKFVNYLIKFYFQLPKSTSTLNPKNAISLMYSLVLAHRTSKHRFDETLSKQKTCINKPTKCTQLETSLCLILGHYSAQQDVLSTIKFTSQRYGVQWFGPGIGCFGIVSLIGNIVFQKKNHLDVYATSDIMSLRILRTSLVKFSNYIEYGRGYKKIFNMISNNVSIEDEDLLFLKYSSLIVLGMINFYTINASNRKIPKDIENLNASDKRVKQSYYKVRSFIQRFVIKLIVPNVQKLHKLYHLDQIECHKMVNKMNLSCLYPLDVLFWWQLSEILVGCMSICQVESLLINWIVKSGYIDYAFPQRYVLIVVEAFANKNKDNHKLKTNLSPKEMKKQLVELSLAPFQLPVLNRIIKVYDIENILKNAKCNQYLSLLQNVLNPSSRDERLFQKWKNVTSIKSCNQCGRDDVTLRACKSCKNINARTFYCSKKCQKQHWNSGIHPVFSSQAKHTQIGRC